MNSFLISILLLYVFIIPSTLFAKAFIKSRFRYLYSFSLILFMIPLISFSLAWFLKTYISYKILLYSSTIIILISLFWLIKNKESSRKVLPLSWKLISTLVVLSISVFIFSFFNFQGLGLGYWDTYIIFPASLMSESGIVLTDIDGKLLYDYNLPGNIPENLIQESSFGISSKDQRLGSAIFYAIPSLLFGKLGFRIFFALIASLIFLLGFSAAYNIFDRISLSLFCGLILSVNPYLLSVDRLNPNILGLALIAMLLSLITESNIQYSLIGITIGILGGIRNVSLIFIPAIIFFTLFSVEGWNWKKSMNRLVIMGFFALLFILPILFWNSFAFGHPLEHPTQYPGLYGFRPVFEHNFFGKTFFFNGLLNYPFHSSIVRTPHSPFPTFLTLPLLLLSSFGLIIFALFFLGISQLYSYDKKVFWFILLFLIPFFSFLLFQENWEDVKTTFILLLFPPISLVISFGLGRFYEYKDWKNMLNLVGKLVIIILLLTLFMKVAYTLEFEKDARWFERFPRASEGLIFPAFESDNMRDEWWFFHTDETSEEIDIQRARLATPNIFPDYKGVKLGQVSNKEMSPEEIEFVDVWRYIYG